jgi:hypothetical protein
MAFRRLKRDNERLRFAIYKDRNGVHYYSKGKLNPKDVFVDVIENIDGAFDRVRKLNRYKK